MTDEALEQRLDQTRAKAAWEAQGDHRNMVVWENAYAGLRQAVILAARYGRENWLPTDPDLVLAREVVAKEFLPCAKGYPNETLLGKNDQSLEILVALAAIRAARGEK